MNVLSYFFVIGYQLVDVEVGTPDRVGSELSCRSLNPLSGLSGRVVHDETKPRPYVDQRLGNDAMIRGPEVLKL